MKELNGADAANLLMLYQDLNNRYLELTNQVNKALEYLKPSDILPCDCINLEFYTADCNCNYLYNKVDAKQYVDDVIRYEHVYNIFNPKPKEEE